jgi:hypothetical protein
MISLSIKIEKSRSSLLQSKLNYIHTNHSRLIPERVAETSQIFLRDTHILPKWLGYAKYCRHDKGGKSFWGVIAVNSLHLDCPLRHPWKAGWSVLLFSPGHHTRHVRRVQKWSFARSYHRIRSPFPNLRIVSSPVSSCGRLRFAPVPYIHNSHDQGVVSSLYLWWSDKNRHH